MTRTVPTLTALLALLLPLLFFLGPTGSAHAAPPADLATETPVIDFADLPEWTQTNLRTFLVASPTPPEHEVWLNGVPIPPDLRDDVGNLALPVPLVEGDNTLELTIRLAGETVTTTRKTVHLNPQFSTLANRLLYVAVDHGDVAMIEGAPAISGTVVIDLDGNALLGMIEGKQIVGISPDGSEIYTHDNSVISTATHQETSVLPFDQEIPSNAFLASPDGSTLYSRAQRVDTETNTLLDDLPVDITTGRYSWGGATKPATPAISADGTTIYALAIDNLKTIDTRANTVASTSVTLTQAYIGDLALSPDETRILLSDYSYGGGRLRVYDAETFELIDSVSTLGDFVGEIAFSQDGKRALVGSAGNPTSIGRISVIDMDTVTVLNHVQLHLADNLDTSGRDQFFVSSGDRSGIDVYVLDPSSALLRTESFFLGINRYAYSRGNPKNDQIRRIVYKGVHERYLPILFGAYVTPISARTERR